MSKVISKTLYVKTPKLPPDIDFIEKEIQNSGIEPLRWAIVDIKKDILTINASGRELN